MSADSHSAAAIVTIRTTSPLPISSTEMRVLPMGICIASSSAPSPRQHVQEVQHDERPDRERDHRSDAAIHVASPKSPRSA